MSIRIFALLTEAIWAYKPPKHSSTEFQLMLAEANDVW